MLLDSSAGAHGGDQLAQFRDGERLADLAVYHAVTVGAEDGHVGSGIDLDLARTAGDRP